MGSYANTKCAVISAVLLSVLASLLLSGQDAPDVPLPAIVQRGEGSYAVVVTAATWSDPEWGRVVDCLRNKHNASVVVCRTALQDSRQALADLFPRYACFVARPEEAGRNLVVALHRMTRKLDDDPYTDLIWAILTGYDAADALRIAQHREPLVARRALAATGLNLSVFDEGMIYSEGKQGVMWFKPKGGQREEGKCPADSTKAIVDALKDFRPDVFVTSGHATTRDWQIGYSFKGGQFKCANGRLIAIDLKGTVYPVDSPNPKVYLPVGNCLIGDIPGRDCMALAYMHSGGVYQMLGYTVATWYGYGGWGVSDYFVNQPGRFTLAEAFYLNNQALVHRLLGLFPDSPGAAFDGYDLARDRSVIARASARYGLRDRDALGLLWDRDTVAFYGDPAWEARLASQQCAWRQSLNEWGGAYVFEVTVLADASLRRPIMAFLPRRISRVEIIDGRELRPVITDNFILLDEPRTLKKGETYRVVFRAGPMVEKAATDQP